MVDIGGEAAIYEQRQLMTSAGTETYPVFLLSLFFWCPCYFGVRVRVRVRVRLGSNIGLGLK